jgi:hypothetical protein
VSRYQTPPETPEGKSSGASPAIAEEMTTNIPSASPEAHGAPANEPDLANDADAAAIETRTELGSVLATMPAARADVPNLLRPTWGMDAMRSWLQATCASDGQTLESKLEGGSLDWQARQYASAFAEGRRGFTLYLGHLRFPCDASTLARLQEGLECGAITGIVIEAFPDAEQLKAIAARVNPDDPARELDTMLGESGVDFLARHFQARGGKFFGMENRLAHMRTMKWPSRSGSPLWKLFHERAAQNGHDIATDYLDANGARTRAYKSDHAEIYADLDDQPTVQDLLGMASMTFTNTKRDVPKTGKILGADGVTTLAQGQGLSFVALLQHKVDTLSPAEGLALASAMSTPAKMSTYPDSDTWVWLAGIDAEYAADATSLPGDLDLRWHASGRWDCNVRVRSVVA